MKNRHIKTIEEKFGFNQDFNKNDLTKFCINLNNKIKFYRNKLMKDKTEFNLNDMFNFCEIMPKGTFYAKALDNTVEERMKYEFSDAAYIVYEQLAKRIKLSSIDDMEFSKFYVLEVSNDNYCLVLYEFDNNDIDIDFVCTNKILLKGNIAQWLK